MYILIDNLQLAPKPTCADYLMCMCQALIDDAVRVSDQEGVHMAHYLLHHEGTTRTNPTIRSYIKLSFYIYMYVCIYDKTIYVYLMYAILAAVCRSVCGQLFGDERGGGPGNGQADGPRTHRRHRALRRGVPAHDTVRSLSQTMYIHTCGCMCVCLCACESLFNPSVIQAVICGGFWPLTSRPISLTLRGHTHLHSRVSVSLQVLEQGLRQQLRPLVARSPPRRPILRAPGSRITPVLPEERQ